MTLPQLREMRTATEQTRSHGVAELFAYHEMLITEADLLDWITTRNHPQYERLFVERRYFREDAVLRYEAHGTTFRVKPDSGSLFRITRPNERPTLMMRFKELDKGTMNFKELAAKFRRWDDWSHSPEGQQYLTDLYADHGYFPSRPTFQLLVIAHANARDPAKDTERLTWLVTASLSVSPRMRRRLYFTTAASMQQAPKQTQTRLFPAAARIWWRLRDTTSWLNEYTAFKKELPMRRGQKLNAHLRRFVADRLPTMPQHSLFP